MSAEKELRKAELAFIWRAVIWSDACETKKERLGSVRERGRTRRTAPSATLCTGVRALMKESEGW